jgi:Lrp/AsnC family transcriptional regulator, leucine-responsive regulatory protein
MTPIDTLDERILSELQSNGRLTMKALAERVGLSSPAMIERVRRLEERGVLAGYRAIVSPAAIGRPLTSLISADVDRRHYDAFLNRLRSEPAVQECHRVTGNATFLIKVHVASTDELEVLVDDLGTLGARCGTTLVLSTPITDSPIVPPAGSVSQRTRLTRRRRRGGRADEAQAAPEQPTPTRRRGRVRKRTDGDEQGEGTGGR